MSNDSSELLLKTDEVLQKIMLPIHESFHESINDDFKKVLMTNLLAIKGRHKLLQNELTALTALETPTEIPFETPPGCKAIFEKQLASNLFDHCNDSVKKIYTYLNHYKGATKESLKAVKAIERLREQLSDYL